MKRKTGKLVLVGAAVVGAVWLARGTGRPAPKAPPSPIGSNPLNGRSCTIAIGPAPGSGMLFPSRIGTGVVSNGQCVVPGFATLPVGDPRVRVN